jgi:hypothetical protein
VTIVDTYCQSLIDTVHICIECDCPALEWEVREESRLYGTTLKTNIKNLLVTWGKGRLRVIGSLPKFITGNNFNSINTNDIKEAIHGLELELNIRLYDADVKRIDLATNIKLNHKVDRYFSCLGSYKGSHRSNIDAASLYYKKKRSLTLIFYDKIKEMKKDRTYKHLLNSDHENLMRFEVRYFASKLKTLFKSPLRVSDLTNLDTNKLLNKLWYNEYMMINKENNSQFNLEENDGWKEISKKYIKQGVDSLGGLHSNIENLKTNPVFNNQRPENKSRILKYLRAIDKLQSILKDGELLDELNSAFALAFDQLNKVPLSLKI